MINVAYSCAEMITAKQRFRISAETGLDPRTVERVYRGEKPTRGVARDLVETAAKNLGYPAPPPPPTPTKESM